MALTINNFKLTSKQWLRTLLRDDFQKYLPPPITRTMALAELLDQFDKERVPAEKRQEAWTPLLQKIPFKEMRVDTAPLFWGPWWLANYEKISFGEKNEDTNSLRKTSSRVQAMHWTIFALNQRLTAPDEAVKKMLSQCETVEDLMRGLFTNEQALRKHWSNKLSEQTIALDTTLWFKELKKMPHQELCAFIEGLAPYNERLSNGNFLGKVPDALTNALILRLQNEPDFDSVVQCMNFLKNTATQRLTEWQYVPETMPRYCYQNVWANPFAGLYVLGPYIPAELLKEASWYEDPHTRSVIDLHLNLDIPIEHHTLVSQYRVPEAPVVMDSFDFS